MSLLISAQVMDEVAAPDTALQAIGPAAAVFGSARLQETHPWYKAGRRLAGQLARSGVAVITGGGPGVMEAANRGAQEEAGTSCGLFITLPFEEGHNAFVDAGRGVHFHHFFTRKLAFLRNAQAFVVFPGGLGTLDELFECLVLMQTGKAPKCPIYLIGTAFWGGLLDWMRGELVAHGVIDPLDMQLISVSDDVDAVVAEISGYLGVDACVGW